MEQCPEHIWSTIHVYRQHEFLPMCPNGQIRIHKKSPQGVSPEHHCPIQPEWEIEKWFHLFRNLTQHLQLASSRAPHERVTQEEARPSRILWSTPHPRPMETHLPPSRIHPCCRWFWHQICWQRTRQPPRTDPEEKNYCQKRLGRQPILWNHTRM